MLEAAEGLQTNGTHVSAAAVEAVQAVVAPSAEGGSGYNDGSSDETTPGGTSGEIFIEEAGPLNQSA